MKYINFSIENYRAIRGKITIDLSSRIIPMVGVNECGKTTILQAIFCFDSVNDKENNGQHLKNIQNLYSTVSEGDCIITAKIQCTTDELIQCVKKAIQEKSGKLVQAKPAQTTASNNGDNDIILMEELIRKKEKLTSISICRNLSSENMYYSCTLFNELSIEVEQLVCKTIIKSMPYILYNDDFNDRPISSISLDEKSSWYSIFQRVFASTNEEYKIEKITEHDDRRRKSILSDVENYLSNTLTTAWSKFSSVRKEISISLDVDIEKRLLQVYIKEQSKGQSPKFFEVTDRSKGFIWYYNFIMKIRFNPKQTGSPCETIFLLDEPGSYLHEMAQADLCKNLFDISKKEGVVIYCTHSPQLLSPTIIPLNTILLVEKGKNSTIFVVPASTKNNTQSMRNTAMQPVYEALQIPEYHAILNNEKILCVEGIYDKYCIETFCELSDWLRVFPSVSAEAIINNIQYFIAYQKHYLALWDNDNEGKKTLGKAKQVFGLKEAENFDLLPDIKNTGKIRMEEMIDVQDYKTLKDILKLPIDATYETIISSLYYSQSTTKDKIIKSLSSETKSNFAALLKIIDKHLQ